MVIESIEFVSQHQDTKYDTFACGVACLMMLLKYRDKSFKTPFEELCKNKYLEVLASANKKKFVKIDKRVLGYSEGYCGAYQESIEKYLYENNILYYPTKYDDNINNRRIILDQLLSQVIHKNIPIMVEIGCPWENEGHWLVLCGYDSKNLIFLDPSYKHKKENKITSKESFLDAWDGISLYLSKSN